MLGAKAVGEPPRIESLATIANAVAAATGVRMTDAPITAEKVLRRSFENGAAGLSQAPLVSAPDNSGDALTDRSAPAAGD